jgi:hypothetical protein
MIEQFPWKTKRQELRFLVDSLEQSSDGMWLCARPLYEKTAENRTSRALKHPFAANLAKRKCLMKDGFSQDSAAKSFREHPDSRENDLSICGEFC